MIREKVKKGIKAYNRYRRHLAKAELMELKGNSLKVRFEGVFCRSCGMDEYFLDLVYELERLDLEAKLVEYRPMDGKWFMVEYEIT